MVGHVGADLEVADKKLDSGSRGRRSSLAISRVRRVFRNEAHASSDGTIPAPLARVGIVGADSEAESNEITGLEPAEADREQVRLRAPHHTISDAGLIGGGHVPMPGDMSLAHHGVRFLDAWPECRRHVLEVLRQPLENGVRRIARASMSVRLPAWLMALGGDESLSV